MRCVTERERDSHKQTAQTEQKYESAADAVMISI